VHGARGIEPSRMQDLPGIMQHDADANEVGVERHPQIRKSSQHQLTRFADERNVPKQPWQRTQPLEE
jgi:hypothetical protein